MAIKIKVNIDPVRIDAAAAYADNVLAEQAEKDTEQFVPALTGSLTNRTRVIDNTIVYPGPYARFLYHGKVMVDPATGSTYAPKGATKEPIGRDLVFQKSVHTDPQAHWFEASKALNLREWLDVYKKAVKKFL